MAAPASTPHQKALRADPPYQYGKPDRFPSLTKPLRWRFTAIEATKSARSKRTVLGRVEQAAWDDINAILTGSITVRDQTYGSKQPTLNQGDRVMCEADEGAGFGEVWTMRCGAPTLTASNTQRTFELTNDLDLLNRSVDEFTFHPDRHHPHGWRSDQIILQICANYQVPINPKTGVVRGHLMSKKRMHLRGSPLDMIRNVVLWERRGHGTRLVIRFDNGHLTVLPLKRSKDLLALGPTLIEAQLTSKLPPEFASAVMMRANTDLTDTINANDAKGRKKTKPSKLHILVESPASVRRFGYVRRVVFSPDAASTAEMRQQAQAWLAAVAKPLKTVTLTLQGLPHLKRGDAIQLAIGDWGMRRQIVFVNQIQHSLTPSDYRMTVQCIFADPYIDRTGLSILYRLQSTAEGAQGIFSSLANAGLGSPAKNDTPQPGPYSAPSTVPPVPGFTPGTDLPAGTYGG